MEVENQHAVSNRYKARANWRQRDGQRYRSDPFIALSLPHIIYSHLILKHLKYLSRSLTHLTYLKSSMAELKRLITHRGILSFQLHRFNNYLVNFKEETDSLTLLQTRAESLTSIFSEFNNVLFEIECSDISQEQLVACKEREAFENKYYELLARSKEILAKLQSDQTSKVLTFPVTHMLTSVDSGINIKLPQVNIPEFKRDYEKWP